MNFVRNAYSKSHLPQTFSRILMADPTSTSTILNARSTCPPKADAQQPPLEASGVLDRETYFSLELPKLFETIDRTRTRIGSAVLLRTLSQPSTSCPDIQARQATLQGLKHDSALRQSLVALLGDFAKRETYLYQLLFGTFLGMFGSKANEMEVEGFGYDAYLEGTRALNLVTERAKHFPPTGLAHLDDRIQSIAGFAETRGYRLTRGPVYRAEKGIITREEKHWWTPCVRFIPSLFKPLWLVAFVVFLLVTAEFVPLLLDMVAGIVGTFWIFLFPLALLYIPIVGGFDRDGCIYPFRDALKALPEVHQLLDDIGHLDTLLALLDYAETQEHAVTLPNVSDGKPLSIRLKGVRNPILAATSKAYVGNDIDLTTSRLTLITGPNSGGKTAFCKTLAQSQVLAQIGSFILADEASLSIADRIFHQAPEISQLADGEGRFGTELRRTKAIFMAASAKSLVIMDELSEGTTHEEKIEISTNILDGFAKKGCATLLITHNHALVDQYASRSDALTRQVEFADGKPTFRLVPGISRVSHADKVAARIGFSKEDIDRHLAEEKKPPRKRKPKSPAE